MGTLLNQKPRKYKSKELKDTEERLKTYIKIAKEHKVSLSDVITTARILELERSNDLFVANGDIHDEQMSGLGEILIEIKDCISLISISLDESR